MKLISFDVRPPSVSQDLDERHGEEPPLVGLRLEVALHPVLVLGLLVEDDDDVSLLEGQLVLVVGFAIVQRPAPPDVRRRIVSLQIGKIIVSKVCNLLCTKLLKRCMKLVTKLCPHSYPDGKYRTETRSDPGQLSIESWGNLLRHSKFSTFSLIKFPIFYVTYPSRPRNRVLRADARTRGRVVVAPVVAAAAAAASIVMPSAVVAGLVGERVEALGGLAVPQSVRSHHRRRTVLWRGLLGRGELQRRRGVARRAHASGVPGIHCKIGLYEMTVIIIHFLLCFIHCPVIRGDDED